MEDSLSSTNSSGSVVAPSTVDPEQRIPPASVPEPANSPESTAGSASSKQTTGSQNNALSEIVQAMKDGPTTAQKGKQAAMTSDLGLQRPLRLLDLPIDILKEIVKEVTHTNDLTSLALCHSALHNLAIPHIYSRFDIVWPDETSHSEPRTGVDALTYGLSTLVMGEDVFGGSRRQRKHDIIATKRRRGNNYAQYTRKFSLGNGPRLWVQEYLITKEGGKMLGTLVALAVARMRNLETFIWDMPTGILRDVWLALSSLGDYEDDDQECRLERLWVRWHDNRFPIGSESSNSSAQPPAPLPAIPPPPNVAHISGTAVSHMPHAALSVHQTVPSLPALDRVEHPTFSVLPPLKSLSVLDIDELSYLDEMSVLIGVSKRKLRELRVGIAAHAQDRDWVAAWDGEGIQQLDGQGSSGTRTSDKRLGGILGILVGHVHDIRKRGNPSVQGMYSIKDDIVESAVSTGPSNAQTLENDQPTDPISPSESSRNRPISPNDSKASSDGQENVMDPTHAVPEGSLINRTHTDLGLSSTGAETLDMVQDQIAKTLPADLANDSALERTSGSLSLKQNKLQGLSGKLQLEILELERVPLAVPALQAALDWTKLTSLTLLHCHNHEQLWKTLRRTFSPFTGSKGDDATAASGDFPEARGHSRSTHSITPTYGLNLKKIHANAVSTSLIYFIKETLAPNSLEVLFLQEARTYGSGVTVDAIYRGALRRHRSSLKKLLIDSSEKGSDGHDTGGSRWRRWLLSREILGYITSGRMISLRELGIAVDYKDWHFFLQRLPQIPHLRSLYIPYVADNVHTDVDGSPKELALQIVDIVTLRPEIELCYMGIMKKCFEILENKRPDYDLRGDANALLPEGMAGGSAPVDMHAGGDGSASDDEDEEDDDDEDDDGIDADIGGDADETESDASEEAASDSEDEDSYSIIDDRAGPKLRLREILFYDDKVAIFKARHGRL